MQPELESDLIVEDAMGEEPMEPERLSWGEMDDDEIESLVNSYADDAQSFATGQLAEDRADAIRDYYGEKHGPLAARDGRSSVVLPETRDTVEWIKPALLKMFAQTDELGRLEPNGPEDEEQSDQRSDNANYVFFRDNHGFMNLYNAIDDALKTRLGFIKTVWDPSPNARRVEYTGLLEQQLRLLAESDTAELLDFQPLGDGTFDATVVHHEDMGRVRVEAVPPEEVRWNRDARSLDTAVFVQHRRKLTDSDLRELGYSQELIDTLPAEGADGEFDEEEEARSLVDDEGSQALDTRTGAMQERTVCENYCRVDVDGDGIAEWVCAWTAGDGTGTMFDLYPSDGHPFDAICPDPVAHKVVGLGVHDLVKDLQVIKSVVLRQILDNLYLANNPRWKYRRGNHVNLDELLRNIPGGPIGVDDMTDLEPIQQSYNVGSVGLPIIEKLDEIQEKRTGVTGTYQAVDINAVDKTAFAAAQQMGQAASRIEMIGRIFAETGIKGVFQKIDALSMKHQNVKRTIRLRGKWIEVDPASWEHEMDATINVGLGSGSREVMAANLSMLSGMLERVHGYAPGWVKPENIYNLFSKIAENLGFKNPQAFLPDPTMPEFQLPAPEPSESDQKHQREMLKIGLEHQREVAKIEIESQRLGVDARDRLNKLRLAYAELSEKLIEEERLHEQQELERMERRGNGARAE